MPWERANSKVRDRHLQRLAVVYVRQSSRQQLVDHQESTRLQYARVDRAVTLGWETDRVLVIDEDLGRSATSAVARKGFQRLVTEIGEADPSGRRAGTCSWSRGEDRFQENLEAATAYYDQHWTLCAPPVREGRWTGPGAVAVRPPPPRCRRGWAGSIWSISQGRSEGAPHRQRKRHSMPGAQR